MIIKRGTVVSHTGAVEWGVGKVVEVLPLKAVIHFSDGIIRKIASSHFAVLQPGDPDSFVSIPANAPGVKVRAKPKQRKKSIEPVV